MKESAIFLMRMLTKPSHAQCASGGVELKKCRPKGIEEEVGFSEFWEARSSELTISLGPRMPNWTLFTLLRGITDLFSSASIAPSKV